RAVLGLRPDVEQDDFAERESLFELGGRELFDPLAEIVAGKDGDLRDVAGGDVAHGAPELGDKIAREPGKDMGPLAPRAPEAGAREQSQVVRRRGDALTDFRRHVLDGALPLGEDIDDLCTPSV